MILYVVSAWRLHQLRHLLSSCKQTGPLPNRWPPLASVVRHWAGLGQKFTGQRVGCCVT